MNWINPIIYWTLSESLTNFKLSDDRHHWPGRLDFVMLTKSGGSRSHTRHTDRPICFPRLFFSAHWAQYSLFSFNFNQIFQKFYFSFVFRVTRRARPTADVSCCNDVTKDQLLIFHEFKSNCTQIWSIFFSYESLIFLLNKNWQKNLKVLVTVRNFDNDFFFSMSKNSKEWRQK